MAFVILRIPNRTYKLVLAIWDPSQSVLQCVGLGDTDTHTILHHWDHVSLESLCFSAVVTPFTQTVILPAFAKELSISIKITEPTS